MKSHENRIEAFPNSQRTWQWDPGGAPDRMFMGDSFFSSVTTFCVLHFRPSWLSSGLVFGPSLWALTWSLGWIVKGMGGRGGLKAGWGRGSYNCGHFAVCG